MPDSVTQILASGPPGAKLNIAVLGDGFAAADQTALQQQGPGAPPGWRVRPGLLLRGQVRLQHLPRQPDLDAVRGQPAGLRRERHTDRRVRRHDRLDDDPQHRARLHLQRLVGPLLARGRRGHRGQGRRRARHLGTGLRPRRRHPERIRRRRLWRRRLPDRHARVELGRHGPRVRPRHRRARRRVLRQAGHVHRRRARRTQHHDQHEPSDPQVEAVRQPGDSGPDRHRLLRRLQRRRRSPPAGAARTTPGSSKAAARGRSASTARRSTAGCAATHRRTARSATRG